MDRGEELRGCASYVAYTTACGDWKKKERKNPYCANSKKKKERRKGGVRQGREVEAGAVGWREGERDGAGEQLRPAEDYITRWEHMCVPTYAKALLLDRQCRYDTFW